MHRGLGWLAVAALAGTSALPALATTGSSASEPWGAPLGAVLAASLERVGAAPVAVSRASAPDDERVAPYLFPAGDLDGDGSADIVALSSAAAAMPGGAPVRTFEARRGVDGSVLWTRDVATRAGLVPVPAATGPAGQAGLLLLGYEGVTGGVSTNRSSGESPFGFGDTGAGIALEVVSLAGDGSVQWSRRYADGAFAYNGTTLRVARALPILGGLLAAPGAATDVLVQLYDRAPDGASTQADTLTTLVLDGGAAGAETGRVITDISGARAQVRVAPDLDGDGAADYLVAVSGANEEVPDEITARRATTGAVLWSVPTAGLDPSRLHAHGLGDVTGDGRAELALSGGALPQTTSALPDAVVRTLDGATGAVLRTTPGQRADVVGDVDRDGVPDLLVSAVRRQGAVSTADVRVVATRRGQVAAGALVLETDGTAGQVVAQQLVGDLDGDGVEDLSLTLAASGVSTSPRVTAVLSGATAGVLRDTPLEGLPLGVSADGRGDDLYRVTPFGEVVRDLTVVDGLTGRDLRTVRLRPRGDSTGFVNVESLAAPGRARLVVSVEGTVADPSVNPDTGRTSTDTAVVDSYVLDAVDGTRRWQTDLDGTPPPPEFSGTTGAGSDYSWSGTPRTGLAVASGGGSCAATDPQQRCERVLVEVLGVPATSATFTVAIDTFAPVRGPVTDLDLRVLDSDAAGSVGPELGRSATAGIDYYAEAVAVPLAFGPGETRRWVLAEILYYSSVESGYRGVARAQPAG